MKKSDVFTKCVINKLIIRKKRIKMEMAISKENVIQLFKNYYKKTEDFNGTIEVITEKELTGYYGSEGKGVAKTKIEIKLCGITVPIGSAITKEEVHDIFQNILSEKDYLVKTISFDQEITSKYCFNEDYKVAHCNGIKLEMEKRVKEYRR